MKGWHNESYRHSLAARGIVTTRFEPSSRLTHDDGEIYIYDRDVSEYPIGNASLMMNRYTINKFYGDRIPDGVAVVHDVKIYPGYVRRGYGRKLLKGIEDRARAVGMERIWVVDVADCTVRRLLESNDYESVWINPYDWIPGVIPEVYEKVLR